MADPNILGKLRERARAVGARAVDELLRDEERAERLGEAVRKVQQGKRVLDERAARMVAAMGFATQSDLDRVSRRIGRLRKRMLAILDRL